MTEERDKMPELPGQTPELLKERKWFGTDTTGLLLDFTKPYSPPMWTLSHNGTPFAKLGDLHIVGGKAGHGKTVAPNQITDKQRIHYCTKGNRQRCGNSPY